MLDNSLINHDFSNGVDYKLKINKAYIYNALILAVSLVGYILLYNYARYGLKVFMTSFIGYLVVANIIGLLLRQYGVIYTKYKPKLFCIDNKLHFGVSYNNRLVYRTYYAYRCWDFSDVMYKNHHDSCLNHFRRYYRTVDGPIVPITNTNNKYYAMAVNLAVTIGLMLTIFIFKE